MNVRIQYHTQFSAGVHYDGQMIINHYKVTLNLTTISADAEDHNTALERVKYFIHYQLSNSIFISDEHSEQCQQYLTAGLKICTLPEEPVDQVIGIMLQSKLNAVMEDRMIVTQTEISSSIGDNIVYLHSDEEPLGPFESVGWWQESDATYFDANLVDQEKVVTVNTNSTWRELGLNWNEDDSIIPGDDKVVFADFGKDETR